MTAAPAVNPLWEIAPYALAYWGIGVAIMAYRVIQGSRRAREPLGWLAIPMVLAFAWWWPLTLGHA